MLLRKKVTEEYQIKVTMPGKHKLQIIEEYLVKQDFAWKYTDKK